MYLFKLVFSFSVDSHPRMELLDHIVFLVSVFFKNLYNVFHSGSTNLHSHQQRTAAAKSFQSCLTLCDPIDGSPPGSTVPGILQTRTLEWVAISFSSALKWKVKVKSLSRARLSATPWTAAHQASSSMGFSRQEYWSGLPLPSLWYPFINILANICYWWSFWL